MCEGKPLAVVSIALTSEAGAVSSPVGQQGQQGAGGVGAGIPPPPPYHQSTLDMSSFGLLLTKSSCRR